MLGAIAGDVIGSVYEGKKRWLAERSPDFQPLFAPRARFTDDTVLTAAVADWLIHGGDLAGLLKDFYRRYPGAGFGGDFQRWAVADETGPYNSWGNGSAMRVSPVAWAFDTLAEVLLHAKESARVSHNHPEGIKGAQATAAAAFLARTGATRWEIREEVERRFQYDLSFRLDDVRPFHVFDSSCQGTVPQALVAFLESEDYESAVRLAVSLGGDCDTLACIAGSVAAAFYGGVPGPIREQALARLDEDLSGVVAAFEARFPPSAGRAWPHAEFEQAFGGRSPTLDLRRSLGAWDELRPAGGWEAFDRSIEVTAFLWLRLAASDWHYLNFSADTSTWEHRGELEGMVFVAYRGETITELRVRGEAGARIAAELREGFGLVLSDGA